MFGALSISKTVPCLPISNQFFSFSSKNPSVSPFAAHRDYRSISEFFTRALRPDVRPICDATCLVSPVDGRVLHFGLATNEQIEQVKGISYSLESFVGPPSETTKNIVDFNQRSANDVSSAGDCDCFGREFHENRLFRRTNCCTSVSFTWRRATTIASTHPPNGNRRCGAISTANCCP